MIDLKGQDIQKVEQLQLEKMTVKIKYSENKKELNDCIISILKKKLEKAN